MTVELTGRQKEILDFIAEETLQGRSPSVREIARAFGIQSVNAVHGHIRALLKKGALRHSSKTARSLRAVGREPERLFQLNQMLFRSWEDKDLNRVRRVLSEIKDVIGFQRTETG